MRVTPIGVIGFVKKLLMVAALASFAASVQAADSPATKSQYDAAKAQAKANYKGEKERCDRLAGNAKDICVAEAKANLKREEARAKAEYERTSKSMYDMQVENAEADYMVAKEVCDDLAG